MRRHAKSVWLGIGAVSLLAAPLSSWMAASAGTPPSLTAKNYYYANTSTYHVGFVTHSPTVIDGAPKNVAGSQYLLSSVRANCPAISPTAVTDPGLPRISLRLVGGAYAFTTSYRVVNLSVGSPGGASKTLPSLTVHLTGTVRSATVISGTLQFVGAPCTTPVIHYTATLYPPGAGEVGPNA